MEHTLRVFPIEHSFSLAAYCTGCGHATETRIGLVGRWWRKHLEQVDEAIRLEAAKFATSIEREMNT